MALAALTLIAGAGGVMMGIVNEQMVANEMRPVVFLACQLVLQGEVTKHARQVYADAVSSGSTAPENVDGWVGIQGILSSAAMVSKMLWVPGEQPPDYCSCPIPPEVLARRAFSAANRKALRKALNIKGDKFAMLENRQVRNAMEHIDSRIEDYYFDHPPEESDWMWAPHLSRFSETQLGAVFYDPPTIVIMGKTVEFMVLADLVSEIADRARKWLTDNGLPPYIPTLF